MFETTKPATTSAKRSTSAGFGDFLSRCLHRQRCFLFDCGRPFPVWFSIHMFYNLSISSISFGLVFLDFVILEGIPTIDVPLILAALPVDKQCKSFPCFCWKFTYSPDSFEMFDYFKFLFNIETFLLCALFDMLNQDA